MSDDTRVRIRASQPLDVTLVPDDELARHVHECRGGWTCDKTQGGCGLLIVEGVPPLHVDCSHCKRSWTLRGGRPFARTGSLLVWYVPSSKGGN